MDNVSYTGQQALPTITVGAVDPSASEQGQDPGVFTITRSNVGSALVVNYTMSGRATNNSDYSTLNGTVTIPSGSSSVNVNVIPIDDGIVDANETAILTLSTSSNYQLGSPNNATVTIADNDTSSNVQSFSSSPSGWTGSNNASNGNSYGWSQSTSEAGGSTGEAGGTFARALSR